ncbi:MAG: PIN domain-containing protein [Actinomycetota bacterium]|nr:PIN domain-containing protein [Actinomycetota bacterium]
MIAVDANLLVYAHVTSYPQHDGARQWLEEQLAGSVRVGLPWASLLAFVRLVTNPRLFTEPESVADAWQQVEAWLDAGPVWLPAPTPRHREVLRGCIRQPGLRANDVPDAHLAALAVEHGLKLATSDRGFARFERLAWFDPLSPAEAPPLR